MDRVNPMDRHLNTMVEARGMTEAPPAAQMFGNAGNIFPAKFLPIKIKHAKKISEKYSEISENFHEIFRILKEKIEINKKKEFSKKFS